MLVTPMMRLGRLNFIGGPKNSTSFARAETKLLLSFIQTSYNVEIYSDQFLDELYLFSTALIDYVSGNGSVSLYSSVVERQSCKLEVRSSILRGGIIFVFFYFDIC